MRIVAAQKAAVETLRARAAENLSRPPYSSSADRGVSPWNYPNIDQTPVAGPALTVPQYVLDKALRRLIPQGECVAIVNPLKSGYALIALPHRRPRLAHRFFWELFVSEVPKGLVLDHLCRNRACVLPSHLRITTHRENILCGSGAPAKHAIKTHCNRGHKYTTENTVKTRHGRRCRKCREAQRREFHRKHYVPLVVLTSTCVRGHEYDGWSKNKRKRTCSRCRGMRKIGVRLGKARDRVPQRSHKRPVEVERVAPKAVK